MNECKAYNGTLAQPRNRFQFNRLRSLCTGGLHCWLGAQAKDKAKNFRLLDGQLLSATNSWWGKFQPNNGGETNLNNVVNGCVAVSSWTKSIELDDPLRLSLYDLRCDHETHFICEISNFLKFYLKTNKILITFDFFFR